jgi:hypothetical protein
MPTINYANSIIYIILDKQTRECYVGSTATSLAKRMYRHREDFKAYNKWVAGGKQGKRHSNCGSFAIIAREQFTSFELERFPCNTKKELQTREGAYIDKYRQEVGALCLNKRREVVNVRGDSKAYYKQQHIANRESRNETSTAYRLANKEHICAYNKAYNLANKKREKRTIQDRTPVLIATRR